jgi:hypothetical protein
MLKAMRLRGQAPVGAICVVTDKQDVELFEEIKRPTIEVWKRDAGKLDWSPVAGLWVTALVRDWTIDQRTELFYAIRAGEPLLLSWLAVRRGRYGYDVVGRMSLVNGLPEEIWCTPELGPVAASDADWRASVKQLGNSGGWYSYGCI